MESRFVDRFEVILLDMGRTFMFEVDRFSEQDHLGDTYLALGGTKLDAAEVFTICATLFHQMSQDSRDPNKGEHFPTVLSYLKEHELSRDLPYGELKLLEGVIAEHEMGTIPEKYAQVLRELARTHRLGIVSDIWSRSDRYYRELERMGLQSLFESIIFSSDIGVVKPNVKIFEKAIKAFAVEKSKIVYIGDSMRRDVIGARAAGLSVIWINGQGESAERLCEPDLMICDLEDILRV